MAALPQSHVLEHGDQPAQVDTRTAFEPYPLPARMEAAWLVLLFAVALVTRLYHFWEAPYLGFVDIGVHAEHALRLKDERFYPPWQLVWAALPYFYAYTLLPFVEILSPPILAQKVAVITFSLVALALTYVFLRDVAGSLFALLAVQALVFSRYFLFYSRYPMEPMDLFMFFAAGLLLFRRGMYAVRWPRSALLLSLAALMLAAGQHIYLSARFLVPVFAVYFFALYFRVRQQRAAFWKGVFFALCFVILVTPLAFSYYQNQTALMARQNEIGVVGRFAPAAIARNYFESFLSFVNRGDHMGNQNVPGTCMVNPGLAGLFLAGMALGVLLIRHEAVQLAFAAFLFALPASSLTVEPWNSKRTMNALLGLAMFAAFPAAYAMGRWGRRHALFVVVPLAVTGVTVWFGVKDFKFHFVDFASHPAQVEYAGYHQTMYATEVAEAAKTNQVVISSERQRPQGASYHPYVRTIPYEISRHVPWAEPTDRDITLLLEPNDAHLLPLLRWYYPSATGVRREFKHDRTLMRYDLPAHEINALLGVQAEIWRAGAEVPSKRVIPWSEASTTLALEGAERVRLHGLVYVSSAFALDFSGKGELACSLGGDALPARHVEGQADLSVSPLPSGWLPWEMIFRPTEGCEELKLTRRAEPMRFVAADPPQTGVRQIEMSDPLGRAIRTLAYVPYPFYYSRWGRHPTTMTAFCGEVEILAAGRYAIEFSCEIGGRVRVNGLLDVQAAPGTPVSRTVELQPGIYSYMYAANYAILFHDQVPQVRFGIRPLDPEASSVPLRWRPCPQSLSAIQDEVQSLLAPFASATPPGRQ